MAAAHATDDRASQAIDREFELLCQAARPRPGSERIQELLNSGVDHRRLLRLADLHGVRLCLQHGLTRVTWTGVPADTKDSLERFRQHHTVRSLAFVKELHRLAGVFAEAGIPFVTFKGPTLSLLLHRDLAQREYGDLDILVPEARVIDAEQLLETAGYRNAQGDHAYRRAFLAQQRQYRFDSEERDVAVDLHWGLTGAGLPFPVDVDELWRESEELAIGDATVRIPGRSALARLLAGHGTKEGWRFLKWLRDFAALIDGGGDLDWVEIHRAAERRYAGDSVLLACAMVHDVLDVPAPRALAPAIRINDRVRSLVRASSRRLRTYDPAVKADDTFTDLDLCQRRGDRVRFLARLAFQPTAGDHSALDLPRPLWPLYYVARPFRVGAKALASIGQHRPFKGHDPN